MVRGSEVIYIYNKFQSKIDKKNKTFGGLKMVETLENILEIFPPIKKIQNNYATIDVFTGGYLQMNHIPGHRKECTCPLCIEGRKDFFETSTGFGVSVPVKGINDYHETFKTDRYDNLYGGHSSITSEGKKKRIDHND